VSPGETSALLKRWALEGGFDRAGVAEVRKSDHGDAYRSWIGEERHAGMAYLARRVEHRLDPQTLVPGARWVLCVALQYANGEEEVEGDLWPRVARYARGRDYHEIMGERLERLRRRIEGEFPGTSARWYVDTGPVLERELAARAGLGAIGKNTNLLHPEAGSYFFLGEVFLDLDLAPDLPIEDLCGSCTACLDACPTQAFPAPFVLDSSRCISYWTIEHRGMVPAVQRNELEGWVFGCDVCQEVCPWNAAQETASASGTTVDEDFSLPPVRRRLTLIDLLGLRRDDYVEVFRQSPMKRAKLEGLQRNAALAMGERGDRRYIEPLVQAVSAEVADVREQAVWALTRLGGCEAEEALRDRLGREIDEKVLAALRVALETLAATSESPSSG
jgi:epoxyqueuosine reductase